METAESFKRIDEILPSFDGVSLTIGQYSRKKPKAHVIIIPPFGCNNQEHVSKYSALWDAGYMLYAMEMRGHGSSSGARLMVERMEDLLDDIDILIARIKDRAAGEPVYLIGDGMGAWLALGCSLRQGANIAGIVLNQFVPMPEVSAMQKMLQAVMAWITPQKQGQAVLPLRTLSADNPNLALPARSVYELMRLYEMLRANIIELITPSLVLTRQDERRSVEILLAEGAVNDLTYVEKGRDENDVASILTWLNEHYVYAGPVTGDADDD